MGTDLTGTVFGRLTVLRIDSNTPRTSHQSYKWVCQCECGNIVSVRRDSLISGNTQSCGCLLNEKRHNTRDTRNNIVVQDDICYMSLSHNNICIFDKEDLQLVDQYYWCIDHYGYAVSVNKVSGKQIKMHELILPRRDGYDIDHIDLNKLNNTKSNLRYLTHKDNTRHQGIRKSNTSGYKGVSWNKRDKYWDARIKVDGQQHYLGSFATREEAAKAYNEAAIKYFGDVAILNTIIEDIPSKEVSI